MYITININLPRHKAFNLLIIFLSTENMFLFSFDLVTKLDKNSISHTAVESLLHKFAVQDFIRLKLLPQFLHKRHCYC